MNTNENPAQSIISMAKKRINITTLCAFLNSKTEK